MLLTGNMLWKGSLQVAVSGTCRIKG